MSSTVNRASSVTKRKSVLAEAGVNPSGETPSRPTRTPTSTSLNRRTSTAVNPSSPSISKTRVTTNATSSTTASTATGTAKKKAPGTTIQIGKAPSPTTSHPSPTSPSSNRRSVVPSTTASRASPLSRRASVTVNQTASTKRVTSPTSPEASTQLKQKLAEITSQLDEKQKEIENLLDNQSQLESQNTKLHDEIVELKENSKDNQKDDDPSLDQIKRQHDDVLQKETKKSNQMIESLKQEHTNLLNEEENKWNGIIKQLKEEHGKTTNYNQEKWNKQIEELKQEHELTIKNEQEKWNETVQSLKLQQDTQLKEHEVTINDLNSTIQELRNSSTNTHVRKLQSELDSVNATLDEFKIHSQQAVEAIERRYRDEMRQLQTGSDDTANVWLEKTKSAQQQVNMLSDELERKESKHREEISVLNQQHEEALEQSKEDVERKDGEIEAQSSQIEQLLFQVESLQNSLEAATTRLEHTTKSNSNSSTTNQANENIHKDCLARLEQKQKELDDTRARITEIREAHDSQLTLMGQEKANAMQDMRKTITSLEKKLASAPLTVTIPAPAQSQTPILTNSIDEEKLKTIAKQHSQEIKTMHDQCQALVDIKEKELEHYSYRIKAIVASNQKELEKMEAIGSQKDHDREEAVGRHEQKIKDFESKVNKLETTVHHWMTLSNNNEVLLQDMKKDCRSHVDENQQLVRLVNQLQNELHRGKPTFAV